MNVGNDDNSGDVNDRIRDAKQRLQRRLRGDHWMDPEEQLPDPEEFVPFATIFKLEPYGSKLGDRSVEVPRRTVYCLSCKKEYPLKDLLEGELNDDQCPNCGRWALDYWRNKKHRRV